MVLAFHFWKRINGDVTGVGKAPLRKRFSKFRQSRINPRLKRFRAGREAERKNAGGKKLQDVTGITPTTKGYLMAVRM